MQEYLLNQVDNIAPIELNVSYVPSSINSSGTSDEAPICVVESFATLALSNLPLAR